MKVKIIFLVSVLVFCSRLNAGQDGMARQLSPFSPKEYSLADKGIEDYPYTRFLSELLKSPVQENWQSTRIDKQAYLEIVEKIVNRLQSGQVGGLKMF